MYRLSNLYWGNGYGFEIGQALVGYAFTSLNLEMLVATVDPNNIQSKKILSKLGFKFKELMTIGSVDEELHKLLKIDFRYSNF